MELSIKKFIKNEDTETKSVQSQEISLKEESTTESSTEKTNKDDSSTSCCGSCSG
jgi:CCGSCS motif protein